jgi:hypothetical protein
MPAVELIEQRQRNGKKHRDGGIEIYDLSMGAVHYPDAQGDWQEIDNIFEPDVAPYNWKMTKDGYNVRVKEDFTAGQIIGFFKLGESVFFQPMAFEWTNDLDQIQQISMPQDVIPTVTNPDTIILPKVGIPSHEGTIRWNDAYGPNIDFQWKCTPGRLEKVLEISDLSDLPAPQQYIIDGGNPVLRLNLIFDPSNDLDIFVDGQEWDKKAKEQTFTAIIFSKDGEALWEFKPLRYWDSVLNEGQSIATVDKRGNSLYIEIRVPYDYLQTAVFPVFIDVDVDEIVGASLDDVRLQRQQSEFWFTTSAVVAAGAHDATNYEYGAGMRFQTIAITNAQTIDTATMILTAHDTAGARAQVACNTRISAEDVDDAAVFADNQAAFEARYAAQTTAIVDWDNIPAWSNGESGADTTSPEIKTVVQEIFDRPGWATGQDLVLFWEDYDDRSTHVNDNRAYGESYDGDTAKCAQLHMEYAAAGVPVHALYYHRRFKN